MIEIILKQEVRKLGDRGDIVNVANGYARNYLFPKQLAMPATAANKIQIDEMQAAAGREAEQLRSDASTLAEKMTDLTVRAVAKAGDSWQLFGSITTRDIGALLAEKGFEIERHKIILEKPIKMVGDYEVRLHLYKDVKVSVAVEVRAEGREDELPGQKAAEEAAEAEAASEERAAAELEAETAETAEAASDPVSEIAEAAEEEEEAKAE